MVRSSVAPHLAHEAVALVPVWLAGTESESIDLHCAQLKMKLRGAGPGAFGDLAAPDDGPAPDDEAWPLAEGARGELDEDIAA